MGNWNGFGAWGMGLGPIYMVLFWAVIIAGVVALVRWQAGAQPGPRDGTALEIVRERYARGEIDREEYEQKVRDLRSP